MQASDGPGGRAESSLMSSWKGLACQRALPWLWALTTRKQAAVEAGGGSRAGGMRAHSWRGRPCMCTSQGGSATGSRLASGTCTVVEVRGTEWIMGSGEGLWREKTDTRWLGSVNMKTCGAKASEVGRTSAGAGCAFLLPPTQG